MKTRDGWQISEVARRGDVSWFTSANLCCDHGQRWPGSSLAGERPGAVGDDYRLQR